MNIEGLSIGEFLDAVGARTPTPGGGAVASVVSAIAAALGRMVLNYSITRKSLAEHAPLNKETLARLDDLARRAIELAEADAQAYAALNALFTLPEDDDQRRARWDDAVAAAIDAPRQVMDVCRDILHALDSIRDKTNAMLGSDLAIAALLADAGIRSAAWNVRINLPLLSDDHRANERRDEIEAMVAEARTITERIESGVSAG